MSGSSKVGRVQSQRFIKGLTDVFDSTALEHTLDKEQYKELVGPLRDDLLRLQTEVAERKSHMVLVLINGADGAGKGEVLNRLYEWMDDHFLETLSYDTRDEDRSRHPPAWRYWRDMPPKGRIGLVLGSWYHETIRARLTGATGRAEFEQALTRVKSYETMLHAEGVRFVKLWLHIDEKEGRRRLKQARDESGFGRPLVEEWPDADTTKERKALTATAFEAIEMTSTGNAPWIVVPAADGRYRDVAVARALAHALARALEEPVSDPAGPPTSAAPPTPAETVALPYRSILSTIDLSRTLDGDAYHEGLALEQRRIFELTSSDDFKDRGLICAFEGNDAAGKGGCIRRVRAALDPRDFRVHGIAAPTDDERARPYLWRFWRHIPRKGRTEIFDRSWYGRVLVERAEGLCSEDDWLRAYEEINEFERQLVEDGYIVVKFWLAISPEEQLRRFQAREETSFKRFKITPDDWRNRGKWDLYERAVTDMVDRTSTRRAPWTLISAEDKKFARVEVLRTVADRLEEAL
ncbi:polyphosphate:AMP phosphotransferase [Chelatococcus reniformis]|uniref:Polyphosphate:AMP phosphotransferase n=1 Tax=Chelatococcus reniformis TaxID=1494448 RepID=A0A916TZF4_9HYPH|nr:polyphosphate:AMP phosphotransferase [Chelatococcus reniformis]GGC54017.1 polyphosphate:AMP phosphotransferase [Chelatococcus reniformis]